jgi:hypothetical protein
VLVEQVDHVGPQPLQRCLRDTADLLGAAVQPRHLTVLNVPAELGGYHDLVTDRSKRLAHEFLVDVRAVDLGSVVERHALIDRAAQHRDHVVAAAGIGAVALGHPHRAEPDRGDLQALPEGSGVHGQSFSMMFFSTVVAPIPLGQPQ